jgi:hypothetical protein
VTCHDPHGQYRRLATGDRQHDRRPDQGVRFLSRRPVNEPDADNAVGVYRLLAGAGYSEGPVPRRARGQGAEHLQPDRGVDADPRGVRPGHDERPHDVGELVRLVPPEHALEHGDYVHPVDQNPQRMSA